MISEVSLAVGTALSLDDAARRVVERYFALRRGEGFLIVTDTLSSPALAETLFEAALVVGAEPVHALIAPPRTSGEEPPAPVAAAMQRADACLCAASRSLYHTRAKGAAQASGTRGCFNAPSRQERWTNGAMTADFLELRAVAERLADRLRGAAEVRVTSPAGTDVVVGVGGREPKGWLTGVCRNAGEISAYPGGEVSLPPLEGTANGIVVVERVMTDIGALSDPITWIVREGEAVDIQGGTDAQRLCDLIDGVPNARNIAELGIGINPAALLCDDITESKKLAGTAHMALGDNAGGYGGVVESPVHLDGMILDATIAIDGEIVVREGELL
jgi:leucyl aminopeptidase (aminopeptidase T)